MEQDKILLTCACHSAEHQIIARKDEDVIDLEIHLIVKRGFFRRLIIGVKFIFGYRCKYGEWDCFSMNKEQVEKLYNFRL